VWFSSERRIRTRWSLRIIVGLRTVEGDGGETVETRIGTCLLFSFRYLKLVQIQLGNGFDFLGDFEANRGEMI